MEWLGWAYLAGSGLIPLFAALALWSGTGIGVMIPWLTFPAALLPLLTADRRRAMRAWPSGVRVRFRSLPREEQAAALSLLAVGAGLFLLSLAPNTAWDAYTLHYAYVERLASGEDFLPSGYNAFDYGHLDTELGNYLWFLAGGEGMANLAALCGYAGLIAPGPGHRREGRATTFGRLVRGHRRGYLADLPR